MNETEPEFKPTRTEIKDRKKLVDSLPSQENMEVEEISILPDIALTGFYDGMIDRTLKEPDTYTGKLTKPQIRIAIPIADNPQFEIGHENSNLRLNESEKESGSVVRFVWCSNGLLRELEENEIQKGQKFTIKRKGTKLNTRWTIIPRN